MISEILGLFVNTLTVNDKYSLCDRENLLQPIQMQFFLFVKVFCQIFAAFLKSKQRFEDFQKQYVPHSLCITEMADCKICGYLNVFKAPFQNTLETVNMLKDPENC